MCGSLTRPPGWHLLDADQEVPWQEQPLTYHFKFRFYFQEYEAGRHTNAYSIHCLLGIGGDVTEYDVPQCPPGTPTENCTHEISGIVTPPGKDMRFVGAHYHCHAPTCLRCAVTPECSCTAALLVYFYRSEFTTVRPFSCLCCCSGWRRRGRHCY